LQFRSRGTGAKAGINEAKKGGIAYDITISSIAVIRTFLLLSTKTTSSQAMLMAFEVSERIECASVAGSIVTHKLA
jgi:hypothetical protein